VYLLVLLQKEEEMTDSVLEIRNSKEPPLHNRNYVGILVIIVVLLALLLTVEIYQVVTSYQQTKLAEERASAYQTRVTAAQLLVSNQQDIISGLMTDYQKDAYGSSVDRIAEQQLIATEYNLTALQIIALQNSQIIELLANAP
jgi:predicted metalloprotease